MNFGSASNGHLRDRTDGDDDRLQHMHSRMRSQSRREPRLRVMREFYGINWLSVVAHLTGLETRSFRNRQAGGSRNLRLFEHPLSQLFVRSDHLRIRKRFRMGNLGTLASACLCRQGTSDAFFLRILEAPPGFEPGMEVLQTSALPLGDGALRTTIRREFQAIPKFR